MTNTKSDKQILVDWYFQMIADQLGKDAEIHVPSGETEQLGEISGPMVEKRLVFRSSV